MLKRKRRLCEAERLLRVSERQLKVARWVGDMLRKERAVLLTKIQGTEARRDDYKQRWEEAARLAITHKRAAEEAEDERDEAHSSAIHWHGQSAARDTLIEEVVRELKQLIEQEERGQDEASVRDEMVRCSARESAYDYAVQVLTRKQELQTKGGDADANDGRETAAHRPHVAGAGLDDGSGPKDLWADASEALAWFDDHGDYEATVEVLRQLLAVRPAPSTEAGEEAKEPEWDSETLAPAAENALAEIDSVFEYVLDSGLMEEGGGLPLYEAMKPLADARAGLAEALSTQPVSPEPTPEDSEAVEVLAVWAYNRIRVGETPWVKAHEAVKEAALSQARHLLAAITPLLPGLGEEERERCRKWSAWIEKAAEHYALIAREGRDGGLSQEINEESASEHAALAAFLRDLADRNSPPPCEECGGTGWGQREGKWTAEHCATCHGSGHQPADRPVSEDPLGELLALAPHEITCRCDKGGTFEWTAHALTCPRWQVGEMLTRQTRGAQDG